MGKGCLRNLITPTFGTTRFGGHKYSDNWLEVVVVTMVSLSLPRSLAFSKTFAEFRTGEGERARPLLHAPRGAGPGRGAGIWGDWAQLRERGGNARSRLPVGAPAAAPRGQTCPAQAAPSPARGKGRGGGGRLGRRGGGGERVGRGGGEGRGKASRGGARGLQGKEAEGSGPAARAGAEMGERSE